jgi:hypothetical protein
MNGNVINLSVDLYVFTKSIKNYCDPLNK